MHAQIYTSPMYYVKLHITATKNKFAFMRLFLPLSAPCTWSSMYIMLQSTAFVLFLSLGSLLAYDDRDINETLSELGQQPAQDTWADEKNSNNQWLHSLQTKDTCPNMWFVKEKDGNYCTCGNDVLGTVQCNPKTREVSVIDCYCVTEYFTGGDSIYVVGECFFNCINTSSYDYHRAPSNCSNLNRYGTLCGKCLPGHTIPAYSYQFKCMKCDSDNHNWWLYVLYAYLPLTVFIVIILLFRINVAAPKLYIFVLIAQNATTPINIRVLVAAASHYPPLRSGVAFIATVYGIWNLDFFRVVLPEVCLNFPPLHILALDYLIAIYPMLLMGVAYIIVELHGRGFRPVLCLWRPFHRFFVQFRRHWGIQTTIMDAFVTFFILSTTKLFSVSFDLLVGTTLYTPVSKEKYRSLGLHLYYDPNIKYFDMEHHLPLAVMAIAVLTVFIIIPLCLLLCYQCKCFLKCLTRCHLRGRTLDEFVNTFHQYYKDGSNGEWDCRWFAGFYLIHRAAAFITFALSLSAISNAFLICVMIIGAIIFLIVEPYNEEYSAFNTVNTNFLLLQALYFAVMAQDSLDFSLERKFDVITGLILTAILLTPLVYIIGVAIHHLYTRGACSRLTQNEASLSVSLPDRLVNSSKYRDTFSFTAAMQLSPHTATQ